MGYKYFITAFNYPWNGFWDYSYGTNIFILAVIKLIIVNIKFWGVDFKIRGK